MKIICVFIFRFLRFFFPGSENYFHQKVILRFFNYSVNIDGHKIFLDKNDKFVSRSLFYHGEWEPLETKIVKRYIKEGDWVLDIGANIGYYTLIFAKLVGKSGRVFAFEPDPNNFALLSENIKLNGYNNVVLIQAAVSDKTGTANLYLSEDNKGDHRIYNSFDGRSSLEIKTLCLDKYFSKQECFNFIKLDIQGTEFLAIKGMSDLIRRSPDLKVLTEFWPKGFTYHGVQSSDYIQLLTELGLKMYLAKEILQPATGSELLAGATPDNDQYVNLLCFK